MNSKLFEDLPEDQWPVSNQIISLLLKFCQTICFIWTYLDTLHAKTPIKTNLADGFATQKLQAVDVLLLLAAGSPCRVKGRWTVTETAMAVTAEEQRWMQLRQRLREVTALHDVSW